MLKAKTKTAISKIKKFAEDLVSDDKFFKFSKAQNKKLDELALDKSSTGRKRYKEYLKECENGHGK